MWPSDFHGLAELFVVGKTLNVYTIGGVLQCDKDW